VSISRRLRFETLRRDDHACRYCGRRAPDVELTVDHVTPVALGGTDDPTNLVAACAECNSGKSSIRPGEAVVDDVFQDALRWRDAMKRAASEMDEQEGEIRRVADRVYDRWLEVQPPKWNGALDEPPVNYADSVAQWLAAGLTEDGMLALIPRAHGRQIQDPWRYFAGCCWTRVRQLQERARQIIDDRTET
jgi:hypothetical protein